MARHSEADYKSSPFYELALRTKLWRHYKLARGLYRTFLGGYGNRYDHAGYWEEYYRTAPVEDSTTIDHGKEAIPTRIHYNAIENLILSHCDRAGIAVEGARVMDIGSGAGHWLRFYLGMGAATVTGVEVSSGAAGALERQFAGDERVTILNTTADQIGSDAEFDIVNAIGVMFHIVDDAAFEASVEKLKQALKPGGWLVIGGEFGLINNVNVQFDREGNVTKRLRSHRRWKQLIGPGWRTRKVVNRSYRLVNATLPEANLLFAQKPGG